MYTTHCWLFFFFLKVQSYNVGSNLLPTHLWKARLIKNAGGSRVEEKSVHPSWLVYMHYLQAWVGHPYFDVVDNSTDFENKILRVIKLVCKRINRVGAEIDERLKAQSKKRKFLVIKVPSIERFPSYQDFEVEHHYLLSNNEHTQCRIRKRGQKGKLSACPYRDASSKL